MTFPALFISHGSPMIAITPSPARDFLSGLGTSLGKPAAIISVSAHFDTAQEGGAEQTGAVLVSTAARPETIHDFGGFPDALYRLRYRAPGDPALAQDVAAALTAAGLTVETRADRGLDHGTWVPLMLAYPRADIPVVQVSINSRQPAEWHAAIGAALAPFRARNVLVIGSGSLTHNLRAFFAEPHMPDDAPPPWVREFADWINARLIDGDSDAAIHALTTAPHGRENHPTPDHFLPLPVAIGAAGPALKARALHRSYDHGVLAMHAYAFD